MKLSLILYLTKINIRIELDTLKLEMEYLIGKVSNKEIGILFLGTHLRDPIHH